MNLIWAATVVGMLVSTLRALNVGHEALLYAVQTLVYAVMVADARATRNTRLQVYNGFYVAVALVGAWRWS